MDVPEVRVELLGPLRVVVAGEPVEVRGPKRRAILALLAFAEGRTVTVDQLVDALWPADPPASARQALHTHLFRLRAQLGPGAARLQTRPDGYRLDLAADELDLARARALLAAARADPHNVRLLREAHALWQGPMLADLTDIEQIATAVEGCARLHRDVTDALVAAAVTARQAGSVLGHAAESVAADPLREPAVLGLMRALAASGQAHEALCAGREYRGRLAEETGLDPSPALGELERDIAGGAAGPVPVPSAAPARPTTRLIGRAAEVGALHRLLATERLVTVTGPGGVGKTRVALEVADRAGTDAVLLLAPVGERAAIAHALAAALNLTVVRGDVLAACVAVLGDRPGLLLVDNCEHLLDAVRDTVGVLLSGCPRLSVLATSREPLGLVEEHVSRLAPLPLPGTGQELADVPSVAVFLERAARVRPGVPQDLAIVADIVRRLDGMPLAIELAAGRLSTFSLADLRGRLDRSLDLLAGGRTSGDARHRTLRATVEWSYQLLSADEQRLFRHLSVFPDGVDLDPAEAIATDLDLQADPGTVLARLVDASMIEAVITDRTRYRMLETLRTFGLDRLAAASEENDATGHMIRWAVRLATRIGVDVTGAREPEADAVLRRELANLRAAWRTARRRGPGDPEAVEATLALVANLAVAIAYRDLVELWSWADELAGDLTSDPALAAHPHAAVVLALAAEAAHHRGDHRAAERLVRDGLHRATDRVGRWSCLTVMSVLALEDRGAHAEAVKHALAAAALAPGPCDNLGTAALALAYAGDLDRARVLNDRGLVGAEAPTLLSWGAYVDGEIDRLAGRPELAERHYRSAVDLARHSGATLLVGLATLGLVAVLGRDGRVDDTLRGYRDVIDYFARTGSWSHLWTTLRNLADLLRGLGDDEPAALIDAAADQAPDAPSLDHPPTAAVSVPGRAAVLALARETIDRHRRR